MKSFETKLHFPSHSFFISQPTLVLINRWKKLGWKQLQLHAAALSVFFFFPLWNGPFAKQSHILPAISSKPNLPPISVCKPQLVDFCQMAPKVEGSAWRHLVDQHWPAHFSLRTPNPEAWLCETPSDSCVSDFILEYASFSYFTDRETPANDSLITPSPEFYA